MTAATRPCHLEVNDSGGWRRVMTFDLVDDEEGDDVMDAADRLLRYSVSRRSKMRLIIPGDTAPLMMWTAADGWRKWVHPAERATQAAT